MQEKPTESDWQMYCVLRTVENACKRLIKNQPKKKELNYINRLMQGPLKKVTYFLIKRSLRKRLWRNIILLLRDTRFMA